MLGDDGKTFFLLSLRARFLKREMGARLFYFWIFTSPPKVIFWSAPYPPVTIVTNTTNDLPYATYTHLTFKD